MTDYQKMIDEDIDNYIAAQEVSEACRDEKLKARREHVMEFNADKYAGYLDDPYADIGALFEIYRDNRDDPVELGKLVITFFNAHINEITEWMIDNE